MADSTAPEALSADYDELTALATTALQVADSARPDLPGLLIPPMQLDPTVSTANDESPDSLGWAGSNIGSPE